MKFFDWLSRRFRHPKPKGFPRQLCPTCGRIVAVSKRGVWRHRCVKLLGRPIRVDDTIPPNEIYLEQDGKIVATITGFGEEATK